MHKKLILANLEYKGKACCVSALYENDILMELELHPRKEKALLGGMYIGKVVKLLPEIHGAFIDIMPHVTCFYPLKEHQGKPLRCGDELLVQVSQEALKTKPPRVTTNLNLSGEYLVLTSPDAEEGEAAEQPIPEPGGGKTAGQRGHKESHSSPEIGISGKLQGPVRKRLRNLIQPYVRDGSSVIIRTAAEDAQDEEILAELEQLYARLDGIRRKERTRTCYSQIEGAVPWYVRILRRIRAGELEKVVTDIPEIFESIRDELEEFRPQENSRLTWYDDCQLSLARLHSLEHALEEATRPEVWLKNGASLMIEQTEAFVAIDVNSGNFHGRKAEQETYRKINLEAAREIVRQLRLRNLYGIILIDFINMNVCAYQKELLDTLAAYVKHDPVRTRVVDMTKLQITELTRKKTRKSLQEQVREA